MKNKLVTFVILLTILINCSSVKNKNNSIKQNFKTITFNAKDGVTITADIYLTTKPNAPLILLFHQAMYSRGEYREIAPKLNALGFNCMAIDQRSGLAVNNVKNETTKSAKKLNKDTKYINAIPDLEAALEYAKTTLNSNKTILWGSSYSSSLVLYMASQNPNDIKAVLSFSPGEYFTINNKEIQTFTNKIKCPVFITSAKNEQKSWQKIYDNITSKKQFFIPTLKGNHGSKALWQKNESHKEYWQAVEKFLQIQS